MIRPFSLQETAAYLGGECFGEPGFYSSVSTDTRTLSEGDLYVALRGSDHDGHDYVDSAIEAGALAVLVEDKMSDSTFPRINVANTLEAYGLLGQMNRREFAGKVVGITGSSGKTSTKNMLNAILSEAGLTWSTPNNYNNEIGVPKTLLNITGDHKFAVVELGARHVGDISYIGSLTEPDVAILLNAGESHLGIFGSYENIVKTKGEIYKTVREGGFCILNADDKAAEVWKHEYPESRFISVSVAGNDADISAEVLQENANGSVIRVKVESGFVEKTESFDISLPLPGIHNCANALAAIAASLCLQVPVKNIKNGLESMVSTGGRLASSENEKGVRIIDDSYNANPSSVRAALQVLSMHEGNHLAVIGTMGELGDEAEKLHAEIAVYCREQGIEKAFFLGEFASLMQQKFGSGAHAFEDQEALIEELKKETNSATTVLVKGSRFMKMENIVNALKDD